MSQMVTRTRGQGSDFSGVAVAGGIAFTSGFIDPAVLLGEARTLNQQAHAALDALLSALEEVGAGSEDVLRVECFLSDQAHASAWNCVWRTYWPRGTTVTPARSTIIVSFVVPGILIEVQAIAAAGAS